MACLCSGDPLTAEEEAKNYSWRARINEANGGRQWETGMLRAPCENPLVCCGGLVFPCCCMYLQRVEVLKGTTAIKGGQWSDHYQCCQGFFPCGDCNQKGCEPLCLCLEVFLFPSCSISATRSYLQFERNIITDPCDNRIIRFNNFIQVLECFFDILAAINEGFKTFHHIIKIIADIVYAVTVACMIAQIDRELTLHPSPLSYGNTTTTTTVVIQQPPSYPSNAQPPPYPSNAKTPLIS